MKQKGGQGIFSVLDTLLLPPQTPSVQAQYETTLNYIRNNLHRMDYPTYVANGWSIGSGSVESACKTVVNQRLKLAGMHDGVKMAPTKCVICERCSAARLRNGICSGREAPAGEHLIYQ